MEDNDSVGGLDDSIYIVEALKNDVDAAVCEPLNSSRSGDAEGGDDLVVTFFFRGEVLPHARFDCTTHTFTSTYSEVRTPVGSNQQFCFQCYCYVCDGVASECPVWTVSGVCHCNSHKKSDFWISKKFIQTCVFNMLDMESDRRLAESLLKELEEELSLDCASFQRDVAMCPVCLHASNNPSGFCNCQSNNSVLYYNYNRVFESVSRFILQAERERPRVAALVMLAVGRMSITHCQPPGYRGSVLLEEHIRRLLIRVTSSVRVQLGKGDLSPAFFQKVMCFYETLSLPFSCMDLRDRLKQRFASEVHPCSSAGFPTSSGPASTAFTPTSGPMSKGVASPHTTVTPPPGPSSTGVAPPPSKQYQCSVCGRICKSGAGLTSHQRVHSKKIVRI